jgi:2-methylcitrate dehydratase PrpD
VKPVILRHSDKLSDVIAAYVVGFDLSSLPPEALESARTGIIDTVGVMLAGTQDEATHIVCDMVEEEGGKPSSTVFGRRLRTSPQLAALANGVAVQALDYDFVFTRGQAVSAVLPALLALAEAKGSTPADVMSAFVVACEVGARLARASPKTSQAGWHATGIVGALAAAVGCARLLALPTARISDVIGIGVSMASGVSANFGTMTKPLHCGHAARNGVTAALLGARGLNANPSALEGASGYFATFSRDLPTDFSPFEDLGRIHNLVEPGYKLKQYACGGLSHTCIDAILSLRAKHGERLRDATKIEIGVAKSAFQRLKRDYPHTVEAAKFSMPFLAAWSALHGAPTISAFSEDSIEDPHVKALAARVSQHVDPEFSDDPEEAPGRVRVVTADGETLEQTVWYASGSRTHPASPEQIERKFLDCAGRVLDADQAQRLLVWLSDFSRRGSFDDFWTLTTPSDNGRRTA